MHILHSKKIEQPIEKLSESFLDLSLNWASVGELKNGVLGVLQFENCSPTTYIGMLGTKKNVSLRKRLPNLNSNQIIDLRRWTNLEPVLNRSGYLPKIKGMNYLDHGAHNFFYYLDHGTHNFFFIWTMVHIKNILCGPFFNSKLIKT